MYRKPHPIARFAKICLVAAPLIGVSAPAAFAEDAAPAAAAAAEPKVVMGGPAPAFTGKMIKGEQIKEFEPGKVYVMEFWATWCLPCRAAIPHINELYQEYKDKGVVVIGQSVWERKPEDAPAFVEKQGDAMSYPIAVDHTEGEADGSKGAMARTWLTAAGISGIPSTWIVKDGRVLWMGHPKDLNKAKLDAALDGTFDIRRAIAEKNTADLDRKKLAAATTHYWDSVHDRDAAGVDAAIEELKAAAPKMTNFVSYRVRADVALGRYAEALAATQERIKGIDDPKKLFGMRLQSIQDLLITNPTDKTFLAQVKSLIDETTIPETDNRSGAEAVLNKINAWVAALNGDYKTAVELQEKAMEGLAQSPLKPLEVRALEGYKNGKPPVLMPAHSRDKKPAATQPTAAK